METSRQSNDCKRSAADSSATLAEIEELVDKVTAGTASDDEVHEMILKLKEMIGRMWEESERPEKADSKRASGALGKCEAEG